MARQKKEIEVFTISSLNLLSKALGAVILLFIIIPKVTFKQKNLLAHLPKTLDSLAKNDTMRFIAGDSTGTMYLVDSTIYELVKQRDKIDSLIKKTITIKKKARDGIILKPKEVVINEDSLKEWRRRPEKTDADDHKPPTKKEDSTPVIRKDSTIKRDSFIQPRDTGQRLSPIVETPYPCGTPLCVYVTINGESKGVRLALSARNVATGKWSGYQNFNDSERWMTVMNKDKTLPRMYQDALEMGDYEIYALLRSGESAKVSGAAILKDKNFVKFTEKNLTKGAKTPGVKIATIRVSTNLIRLLD